MGTVLTITLDLRLTVRGGGKKEADSPSVTYETRTGSRTVNVPEAKLAKGVRFRPAVDSDENGEFMIEWAEPAPSVLTRGGKVANETTQGSENINELTKMSGTFRAPFESSAVRK